MGPYLQYLSRVYSRLDDLHGLVAVPELRKPYLLHSVGSTNLSPHFTELASDPMGRQPPCFILHKTQLLFLIRCLWIHRQGISAVGKVEQVSLVVVVESCINCPSSIYLRLEFPKGDLVIELGPFKLRHP